MGRRVPSAASIPFTVIGMVFFPYTSSVLSCVLVFAVFYFAMNVKYDTYPLIAYDIARKPYWGWVNGLTWCWEHRGLAGADLAHAADGCEGRCVRAGGHHPGGGLGGDGPLFQGPPLRTGTPPDFKPVKVIGHVIRVGFSDKRIVQLFVANALVCGFAVSAMYIPL